jgi:hypothetical protein
MNRAENVGLYRVAPCRSGCNWRRIQPVAYLAKRWNIGAGLALLMFRVMVATTLRWSDPAEPGFR